MAAFAAAPASATSLDTEVILAFGFQNAGDPAVQFGNTEPDGTGSSFPLQTTLGELQSGIELFLPGSVANPPDDPTAVNAPFIFTYDLDSHVFTYDVPVTEGGDGPQIPGGSLGVDLEFDDGDFIGFALIIDGARVDSAGGNPNSSGFTFDPTAPDFSAGDIAERIVTAKGPGGSTFAFNTVEAFADAEGASVSFDLKISHVPLPAPLALLLTGVAGLAAMRARRSA